MKRTALILSAAALTLVGTVASAQPGRGYDHRGGYDNRRFDNHRGSSWQRGGYLPSQYRGRDRYVSDWARYRLSAPPRGYGYYRQDNGDFVLAALASGLISNLVTGGSYGSYGATYSYAPTYGYGYAPASPIYRDAYGRPYTIDAYGRTVWVR